MTQRDLERAALDAHRRGLTWGQYWPTVAQHAGQLEPHSTRKYRRLVDRLVGLVVAGDTDGAQPAGDPEPWERDDTPGPHDRMTRAKCQLPLAPMPKR
jgi:hypothetical protein